MMRNTAALAEFTERLVLKSRTETNARKKNEVIFVLIFRTNFGRNFVGVLSARVRDFSAVTIQLNPRRSIENKQA